MFFRNSTTLSIYFLLLLASHALAAEDTSEEPIYYKIFRDYDGSVAGAVICGIAYILIGGGHSWFMIRNRSWWSWCLPLGAVCSGIGLILRGVFISQKSDSLGLYAQSQAYVVCMPALFLAYNYMLYVRLIMHNIGAKHSFFKPTIIAKMFVGIDVFTFIVQGSASPLQINDDPSLVKIGTRIFQVGVIVQSLSYYAFCFFIVWTHYRVKTTQTGVTGREAWWVAVWCLYFSSLLIVIRSIYRIIEAMSPMGTGVHKSEGYLYAFDVVPLILCTIPYLYRWPANLLGKDRINHDFGVPLEPSTASYKRVEPQASTSAV